MKIICKDLEITKEQAQHLEKKKIILLEQALRTVKV
jgi:hypothetical protein